MEFDKALIEKSLKIWNFDVDQIDIEKIQHIPMHEWRVATADKPLLFIENLQCCIGLYCYGNNFAFASHINTVAFANDEYALDQDKKPISCNRCYDLLTVLENFKGKIVEPFKIGLSYGVAPLKETEKAMILIYQDLHQVINKMNELGIPVVWLENITEPEFIIDAVNNCLIGPKQNETFKKKV